MNRQQPWFYVSSTLFCSTATGLACARQWLIASILIAMVLLQAVVLQSHAVRENSDTRHQSGPSGAEVAYSLPDMSLLLEIVINGRPTGKVVSVEYRQEHYYLATEDFRTLKLPLSLPKAKEVAVDTLPEVKVEYDSARQELRLVVPTRWLPEQRLTAERKSHLGAVAEGNSGFLINYDLYSTYQFQDNRVDSLSAWTEQRLFGRYGTLLNTGTYNHSFSAGKDNRYTRFETRWQFEDEERMLQYNAGDIITAPMSNWGNAVWMGGINISRNFTLRPDLITYPLPEFKGQAALPGTLDLFINDYQHMSTNLQPGPFSLSAVPVINGAGSATMTVTDIQGKKVVVNMPFYVATELLAKGLSDFSFSAGKLRKNYGIKNFSYGENVASGMFRYGISNALTLQSRMEAGRALINGGAGAAMKLWNLGVLEGGYSLSRSPEQREGQGTASFTDQGFLKPPEVTTAGKRQGHQSAFGYSYDGRHFSINGRRIINSPDYNDLGSYSSALGHFRRQDQAAVSVSMNKWGSIGMNYIGMYNRVNNRFRLLGLSYNKGIWGGSNVVISANREIGNRGYNGSLMLTMPFKRDSYITYSANRDKDKKWSNTLYYAKNTPMDEGWGANISVGRRGSQYSQQTRLEYAHRNFLAQGGIYGDRYYTGWGELQGAVVLMDGHAYASRPIYDAFTLVSTEGYADIPVMYENQPVGITDKNGYLLIPYVTSYYNAKYAIDPMNLPASVDTPVVEQRKMTRANRGSMVSFSLGSNSAITLILLDPAGAPLPVGSRVRLEETGYTTFVGWDGETYLQATSGQNSLQVQRVDDNKRCRAQFTHQEPLTGAEQQGSSQMSRITCIGENNE